MGRFTRYARKKVKRAKKKASDAGKYVYEKGENVGSIAAETVETGVQHAKSYADVGAALVGGTADIVGDTALTVGDIALGPMDEIALAGAGAIGTTVGKGISLGYDAAEAARDVKGAAAIIAAGALDNEDLATYGRHLMDTKGYAGEQALVDKKTAQLEGWLNDVTREALSHGGSTKQISQSEWSDLKKRNKERAKIALAKAEGERAIMKGDAEIYHQFLKETSAGMSKKERDEARHMKEVRETELRGDHPQADAGDYLSSALLVGGMGQGLAKGGKMGAVQGAITGVAPALLKARQHAALDKGVRDSKKRVSRWYDRYLR